MQGNKGYDSTPELAVRRAVHALGLRYRVGTRPLPGLNRRADLVFRRARVAVFVDGCFWHGCPDHFIGPKSNVEYWNTKIGRNVVRDRDTTAVITAGGWEVVRVWEHEDPTLVADAVAQLVGVRLAALGTA